MMNGHNDQVWIIGGGQFGRRAAEQLQKKHPRPRLVVIDRNPLADLSSPYVQKIQADGITWFSENFRRSSFVTAIIPALPVHLAAQWLKHTLTAEGRQVESLDIPEELLDSLPHPYRLRPDCAVVSHADFLCPPNCSEPNEICTHTGKKRSREMYTILENTTSGGFLPHIVRSRQIAPGVGGFAPGDLWSLLENVKRNPDKPLLIGTACKCHGVIDTFLFR